MEKSAPQAGGLAAGGGQRPAGHSMYRRLIDIHAENADEVIVWMEDNYHHFAVKLLHNGAKVTGVAAMAVRTPWSTCAAAAAKLQALVGQALVARASAIGEMLNMRMQCTHMFDIAGLALAAAANGITHRVYQASVTLREPFPAKGAPHTGRCTAILCRDGVEIMNWLVEDEEMIAPEARSLLRGFRSWTETLGIDEAEAALVLRRALMVSGGLSVDLDGIVSPLELDVTPLCHSYQPDQAVLARRNKGISRDYSLSFEGMLADRRFIS